MVVPAAATVTILAHRTYLLYHLSLGGSTPASCKTCAVLNRSTVLYVLLRYLLYNATSPLCLRVWSSSIVSMRATSPSGRPLEYAHCLMLTYCFVWHMSMTAISLATSSSIASRIFFGMHFWSLADRHMQHEPEHRFNVR